MLDVELLTSSRSSTAFFEHLLPLQVAVLAILEAEEYEVGGGVNAGVCGSHANVGRVEELK